MQTLHLQAEDTVIDKIMDMINQFALKGKKVELLDSVTLDVESQMIVKSLQEEKQGKTIEHDTLWDELLN
ncbi:MAG: hypothetical protein KU38_03065 [Sulfurovum sp. FS08-3]|nr:MAG: hypothetical protein KU38_03065 [Sulfurovum sp. FS08-3]